MSDLLMNSALAERCEIELILSPDEKITLDQYTEGLVPFNSMIMAPIKDKLKLLYSERLMLMPIGIGNLIDNGRDTWLKDRLVEIYITYGEN